ncbi:GNAT family N-acetyltransferase [Adhaeribacter rhizoryzae]|uniref:GNAT family N-acetyltransferase n=1 Tax=Adhaeribacter rhizoryzae TaxID=2607907 RepID=A0A5M6D0E0_9BACT|nr:GNAT family N-acetyltransferase [Adhaeribacter rhizoryzae]KAA5538615.1 GNAT family N-acetyltransferase [Adhaeribacter rhizoryzae]
MNLLLTLPHKNDYSEFFEMNKDPQFQKEFPNLRGQTIQDARNIMDSWIKKNQESGPSDFVFIKIAKQPSPIDYYDSSNSKMIGFITVGEAGLADYSNTGFKTLLNYGIIEKYRNKGLMTLALNMRLQAYLDLEYTILPAYIKGDNPASESVLKKCGFIRIDDNNFGSTYVKRLHIDAETFNDAFTEV